MNYLLEGYFLSAKTGKIPPRLLQVRPWRASVDTLKLRCPAQIACRLLSARFGTNILGPRVDTCWHVPLCGAKAWRSTGDQRGYTTKGTISPRLVDDLQDSDVFAEASEACDLKAAMSCQGTNPKPISSRLAPSSRCKRALAPGVFFEGALSHRPGAQNLNTKLTLCAFWCAQSISLCCNGSPLHFCRLLIVFDRHSRPALGLTLYTQRVRGTQDL